MASERLESDLQLAVMVVESGRTWSVILYVAPPGKYRLTLDTEIDLPSLSSHFTWTSAKLIVESTHKMRVSGYFVEPEVLFKYKCKDSAPLAQRQILKHITQRRLQEAIHEHGTVTLVHDDSYEKITRKRFIKIPK